MCPYGFLIFFMNICFNHLPKLPVKKMTGYAWCLKWPWCVTFNTEQTAEGWREYFTWTWAFFPFHTLLWQEEFSLLYFSNDCCTCVNHHHQCLIGVGCRHGCRWRFSCSVSAHDLHFFSPGLQSVKMKIH